MDLATQHRDKPRTTIERPRRGRGCVHGPIVELVILHEDGPEVGFRNADSSVPDLDAQHPAATAAAQQNLAGPRVLDRIGQQVAQHLLEQAWFSLDQLAAGYDRQRQRLGLRVVAEFPRASDRRSSFSAVGTIVARMMPASI